LLPIRQPESHLYTLRLTASGWAWEYLRRNPDYQYDWQLERRAERRALGRPPGEQPRTPGDRAARWGLVFLEPPDQTGLEAVPFWRADAIPGRVRVAARPGAVPGGDLFDLFAEPGNKAVCLTPEGAYIIIERGREGFRLRFADPADLRDRLPVEVRFGDMRSDEPEREAALRFVHRADGGTPPERFQPTNAVNLMRQLQALDAQLAGATGLREIAEAVYGLEAVARDWSNPDGVLRRRTRYLAERGTELMHGAYRTLLRPLKTKA
jgi:hypothetical protein